MKGGDKVCHKVLLKSDKQLQAFKRREDRIIQGVPRIILGKVDNGYQQIWVDELKSEPIARLKEMNSGDKAFIYAKKIIQACLGLASYYGFFIVNENMIFFNATREVFVWINPDLLENHIKIYLPKNHDGELAMIRSIFSYLKLWLRIDYSQLADVKHLQELLPKLELSKNTFKARSPEREFLVGRRNSVNLQASDMPQRMKQQNSKVNPYSKQMLIDSKSVKQLCRSPNKQCEPGNNKFGGVKFGNNQLTSQTQKSNNFEHNTFNTNTNTNTNSNSNSGNGKIQVNNSVGMKSGAYFPNKTTSNPKNSIVSLINKLDQNSQGYVKNKILLDEQQMKLQQAKIKKMKESLDGIGEELNDLLFSSQIENEEQNNEYAIKKIEQEFEDILG